MTGNTPPNSLAGLPLVMLPGTLCDERIFTPFRRQLAGLEGAVVKTHYARSLDLAADQVLAQAPDRFVLLGFSLGGLVAMEAALAAPDRVAGLILVSTTPLAVPQERHAARNDLVVQAQTQSMKLLIRDRLWPEYGGEPSDTLTLPLLEQMAEDLGVEALAAQTQAALRRSDFCPRLHALSCPVLIVAGQEDVVCPPHTQQRLAAALPGSTTAMIPGAGHFALFERPDELGTVVAAWLHSQMRCVLPLAPERA